MGSLVWPAIASLATLIVVTADHGEEFFEHGKWDHHQLYREVLHIPLIIRDPRSPNGARRSELVDLVDVMPTTLAALEIPVPATSVGRTLDLGSPDGAAPKRMLIAEEDAGGLPHAFLERAHAATDEHLSAARSHRKRYQLGPLFKRDHKLSREERDQLRMLG